MNKKFLTVMDKCDCPDEVFTDLAFAICQADELFGENRRELTIQKLLASTDVFVAEGKTVNGAKQLPRVQLYRVFTDVALIVARKNGIVVEGEYLTNDYSDRVAKAYGVSMNHTGGGYGTEEDCERIMDKLLKQFNTGNDKWVGSLTNKLEQTHAYFMKHGYTQFEKYMSEHMRQYSVPVSKDNKYFKDYGEERVGLNRDNIESYLCTEMLYYFSKELCDYYKYNYAMAQLILRKDKQFFGEKLIGLRTEDGNTFDVCGNNIPVWGRPAVNALFDEHEYIEYGDIPYLLSLIIHFNFSHSVVKEFSIEKALNKMKEVWGNDIE